MFFTINFRAPAWLTFRPVGVLCETRGFPHDLTKVAENEVSWWVTVNQVAKAIPWTEKPGRLESMGSQKSWTQLSD